MKKIFTLLFLMAFGFNSIHAQAIGDYGSILTGNWNGTTTWGIWNGATFAATTTPPDGSQNVFIQSGANVTVTAAVTFTKTLTMNGGNLVCGTSLITFSGTSVAIVRASTTGSVSGTPIMCPAATDVLTLTINASCSSGADGLNAASGKNHLVVASGVTYTLVSNRQVDNVDLVGTAVIDGTTRTLTVRGNISGTGESKGTVALRFGSGPKTISAVTFNNLTVNYSGTYTLNGSPTVNGILTLTANHLVLSTFNLTIGSAGSISGGASTSMIVTNSTGKLVMPVTGGAAKLFPIGTSTAPSYDPVTITAENSVTFTVGVSQTLSPAVNVTAKAVSRIWDLTATGAGITTLAFTPLSTTLNVNNTPGTAVYGHYKGGVWNERFASYASGTWTVTHPSAAGFSPFGVGVATAFNDVVLPIELTKFDVKRNQKTALLSWTTASEKNNAAFHIEQSINGRDYQTIGQVKGNGTTNAASNYTFIHTTPSVGINYYRLKQVDFDGTSTLSAVKSALFGKTGLVVKNTLANDAVNIIVGEDATTVSIFNMSGQQVLNQKVQGEQQLDVSRLPSGMYTIRTITGDVGRFVKH
jgi:hypothetical protein